MSVGETIRKIRKEKGLTQQELSQKADMPTITIQNYERGVRQPRIEQLTKISDALETPIGILLGHEVADIFSGKSSIQISLLKVQEELEILETAVFNGTATNEEKIRYADLNGEIAACFALLNRMSNRRYNKSEKPE